MPSVQKAIWRLVWSSYHPGHFYSPIPSEAERRNGSEAATANHDIVQTLPGIDLCRNRQREMLQALGTYAADFRFPHHRATGFRYYRDNGYYIDPDAVMLFCFLRHLQPRRVIEIGCGFSSALILDTIAEFVSHPVDCRFIDPDPSRLIDLAGEKVIEGEIVSRRVQDIEIDSFRSLQKNDVLVIDSSHVLKHDSDVAYILFQILPMLNDGVIIHFHDVCYPFEYPRRWLESGRAWNEAYALRSFLQFNGRFTIEFWNHYAGLSFPDLLKPFGELFQPGDGSALYLRSNVEPSFREGGRMGTQV